MPHDRSTTARRLGTAILPAALMLAAPACAGAAGFEGIWSFNGGQVAITDDGAGLRSRVLTPTTLSTCPHTTGAELWSAMTPQPDGQLFAEHEFLNSDTCAPGSRGHDAMRVLAKPDGTPFLRTCTNTPDDPVRPSIAADGTVSDLNFADGCDDSDYGGPVPPEPTISQVVKLPSTKRCASRRKFRITLREPRPDRLLTARIYVQGRKKVTAKRGADGRLKSAVDLRNLPKGRYTVRIVASTALGRTVSGTRKYRTCTRRGAGSGGRL